MCFCFPVGVVFPQGSPLYVWEIRASCKQRLEGWVVHHFTSWLDTQGTWGSWPCVSQAPESLCGLCVMSQCPVPTADLSGFFFPAVPDPLWRKKGDRLGFRQQVNMSLLKPFTVKTRWWPGMTSFCVLPLQPHGVVIQSGGSVHPRWDYLSGVFAASGDNSLPRAVHSEGIT